MYDPETIRNSVLEEAKNHYELNIKELHADVDQRKEQFNALHYEHTVLRCKLESRESEHSHMVERLKVQHYSEVHVNVFHIFMCYIVRFITTFVYIFIIFTWAIFSTTCSYFHIFLQMLNTYIIYFLYNKW